MANDMTHAIEMHLMTKLASTPDKLTPEEREMIVEFVAAKKAEEEARKKAERSLEDRIITAYEDCVEGSAPVDLIGAVAQIAAFWTSLGFDELSFDGFVNNLGQEVLPSEPNVTQFQLAGVLYALCDNADWALKAQQSREYNLRTKWLPRARAQFANDEISREALHKEEQEYGRCTRVILPKLEDWHKLVMALHLTITGYEWEKRVRKGADPAPVKEIEDRWGSAPQVKRQF